MSFIFPIGLISSVQQIPSQFNATFTNTGAIYVTTNVTFLEISGWFFSGINGTLYQNAYDSFPVVISSNCSMCIMGYAFAMPFWNDKTYLFATCFVPPGQGSLLYFGCLIILDDFAKPISVNQVNVIDSRPIGDLLAVATWESIFGIFYVSLSGIDAFLSIALCFIENTECTLLHTDRQVFYGGGTISISENENDNETFWVLVGIIENPGFALLYNCDRDNLR